MYVVCPLDNYSVSNMIVAFCRYDFNMRHRVVEDKLMRQKAQLLLDEAATWSLLWYLYGKGNIFLSFILLKRDYISGFEFVMMFNSFWLVS